MSDKINELLAVLQEQLDTTAKADEIIPALTFETLIENLAVVVHHQTNRSSFSCHENVVKVVQALQAPQLQELVTELKCLADQSAANIFVKCLTTDINGYYNQNAISPCKEIWEQVFAPDTAGMTPLIRLQKAIVTAEGQLRNRVDKWERLLSDESALVCAGMASQLAQTIAVPHHR